MDYPHLTRILSAEFPKLKLDKDTPDLDKIGGIVIDNQVTTVPEFLSLKNPKVKGDLDLADNQEVTSLPEGLEVGGNLWLSYTPITSLPEGLKVVGLLTLCNSNNITSLPQKLTVGGDLKLLGTKITSLPNDLKVGGHIFVDDADKIIASDEIKKKLIGESKEVHLAVKIPYGGSKSLCGETGAWVKVPIYRGGLARDYGGAKKTTKRDKVTCKKCLKLMKD